jgi:hypothetical protein
VDLAIRYLELVLRLGRLEPSLMDSYHGPSELPDRIAAEAPSTPTELAAQAGELRAAVQASGLAPSRAAWLSAQLDGLETVCEWLSGEPFSYRELVRRCYGAEPRLVPEAEFAAVHDRLGQVLPGTGDVRDRYQRWAETQLVAPELLIPGLTALAVELQRRSRERFELPPGEEVRFELVRGTQFAGNAEVCGELRTRIQINDEVPIPSYRLLDLVAHEAYPGHHTEAACKHVALVDPGGCIELNVFAFSTPQALMAEGIAMLALGMVLGEDAEAVGARILQPIGIPYDDVTSAVAQDAEVVLMALRPNLAILLDEQTITEADAWAYARKWMLDADDRVDRTVSSLLARVWKPYESCYPEGLALCRRFVGGDPDRFKRLLHEQLTPADLMPAAG